ncbi:MAG: DUF4492 domain-containing protein [Muribaculaceae bacterium]|nr:DUF4492 domain-containing protein [Muribaculaceae bacterium]
MKFLHRVIDLYADGFRHMTVGKSLWAIIIVKLIFIFLVMKMFFFPDILERDYPDDPSRSAAVRTTLLHRSK